MGLPCTDRKGEKRKFSEQIRWQKVVRNVDWQSLKEDSCDDNTCYGLQDVTDKYLVKAYSICERAFSYASCTHIQRGFKVTFGIFLDKLSKIQDFKLKLYWRATIMLLK